MSRERPGLSTGQTSPEWYLFRVIFPTVGEALQTNADIRAAMLACLVTYHFVDVWALACREDYPVTRDRLLSQVPSLRPVMHVCLASKHIVLKKGGSLRDVQTQQGPAFSDGSYYSDGTSHAEAPTALLLGDGTDLRLALEDCARTFERLAYAGPSVFDREMAPYRTRLRTA